MKTVLSLVFVALVGVLTSGCIGVAVRTPGGTEVVVSPAVGVVVGGPYYSCEYGHGGYHFHARHYHKHRHHHRHHHRGHRHHR